MNRATWTPITSDIVKPNMYLMAYIDPDGNLTAIWWAYYDSDHGRWREVYTNELLFPTHYIEMPKIEKE